MRICLSDPALVPGLLDFLSERVDCVLERVGGDQVRISILGSYRSDAARAAVERLLLEWRVHQPSASALLLLEVDSRSL